MHLNSERVLENYSGTSVLTKNGKISSAVGQVLSFEGDLEAAAPAPAYADPLGNNFGSVGFAEAFTLALNTGHFYFAWSPGSTRCWSRKAEPPTQPPIRLRRRRL